MHSGVFRLHERWQGPVTHVASPHAQCPAGSYGCLAMCTACGPCDQQAMCSSRRPCRAEVERKRAAEALSSMGAAALDSLARKMNSYTSADGGWLADAAKHQVIARLGNG